MVEYSYNVCIEEEIIAENMWLDDALLLVKALSEKYCKELINGKIVGIREKERINERDLEMVRIKGFNSEMKSVKND